MSTTYMTAKLNLADGTIIYPQVSLDNIVASISDPTLVSVATLTGGTVAISNLPVVTAIESASTDLTVPTAKAVYDYVDQQAGGGSVTGIASSVSGGTATVTVDGGTGAVKFVGAGAASVSQGQNGEIVISAEGTVTGIEASVSGSTATIEATGSTTSVNLVGKDGVLVQGNTNGEVEFGVPAVSKHAVFSNSAATLAANTELVAVENCDNMKNDYIAFYGNFETFGTVNIWHRSDTYGYNMLITPTALEVYSGSTRVQNTAHKLTFSDFIYIIIHKPNTNTKRTDVTIVTNGGTATISRCLFYGDRGPLKASSTAAMTNVSLSYTITDTDCPVWVFGDSYIDFMVTTGSWAYQFIDKKHTGVLFCGHSTAKAADEWESFVSLTSKAIPRYVVWDIGMNDGDTNSAINASWKTVADSLVSACDALGITLIFCTIPNGTVLNQTYKNAWIKASGFRYVDFARALNMEAPGSTGYSGLMKADGVHPTELGAITLMNQFILDCPEAVLFEDNQLPLAAGERMEFVNGTTIAQSLWFPIQTLGGREVIMGPGRAYIETALNSAFTIKTVTIPANSYGLESHLELFVGKDSYVVAGTNVVLVNAIQANSVNNLLVRFHDGKAIVSVEDHVAGYVVKYESGTSSDSLPYGLSSASDKYITFNAPTDGLVCNMSGAVTNGSKQIIGNGLSNTIITGDVSCTSPMSLVNLTLSGGAIVADSSLVFDSGHYAPDTVSGAGLLTISGGAIVDLTGNINATPINPGGGVLFASDGATIYPSVGSASAIFIGGGALNNTLNSVKFNAITNGGHLMLSSGTRLYYGFFGSNAVIESGGFNYYGHTTSNITISNITFSAGANGGNTFNPQASNCQLIFESVSFVNSVDTHNCYMNYGGTCRFKDCSFDKPVRIRCASAEIEGNNTIIRLFGAATDAIRISSGASIQLTSSIEGAITVLDGGCVVNGTSLGSAGGSTTYTKITSVGGSASGTLA